MIQVVKHIGIMTFSQLKRWKLQARQSDVTMISVAVIIAAQVAAAKSKLRMSRGCLCMSRRRTIRTASRGRPAKVVKKPAHG